MPMVSYQQTLFPKRSVAQRVVGEGKPEEKKKVFFLIFMEKKIHTQTATGFLFQIKQERVEQ
jgi:hypothetical protein